MKSEKTGVRGGYRQGAGRPKSESKLFAFRAEKPLADYIDSHENKSDFIKDCISRQRSIEEGGRSGADSLRALGYVSSAEALSTLTLPYYENIRVVAGFPIPLDNDEISRDVEILKMLCPNPEASYLIRVQGDSMIDAGINHGDIIIVDKSNRNPSEKEVAVCELNGEYTIKRFVRNEGRAWLVPANPDYPEIEIKPEDSFCIWGTVTYVIHKARV